MENIKPKGMFKPLAIVVDVKTEMVREYFEIDGVESMIEYPLSEANIEEIGDDL